MLIDFELRSYPAACLGIAIHQKENREPTEKVGSRFLYSDSGFRESFKRGLIVIHTLVGFSDVLIRIAYNPSLSFCFQFGKIGSDRNDFALNRSEFQ